MRHNGNMNAKPFGIPAPFPLSNFFRAKADGATLAVGHTNAADFAILEASGPFELEITADGADEALAKTAVKPLSLGVAARVENGAVKIAFPGPLNVLVEIPGLPHLFVFANPPMENPPDRADAKTWHFAAGKVYDAGRIELKSGETLFIEGGAIVRGFVVANDAENARVCGGGILDGGLAGLPGFPDDARRRMITFARCRDSLIEGILMTNPTAWMTVIGDSDRVRVRNIKQIGEVVCSDGIDVCGSRDIAIEGCFLTNNDDCIVVKALKLRDPDTDEELDFAKDVRGVSARSCALLNRGAGNAMEIGYETRAESISSISFEDIDVIYAHAHASIFSIHNGDRATISNIRYEDIRIEHYWCKLVDFRVMKSRYTKDAGRGHVRGIVFKRVRGVANIHNTPSLIGGCDEAHLVEDIVFEDFQLGGEKVLSADALHLFTSRADGIAFKP